MPMRIREQRAYRKRIQEQDRGTIRVYNRVVRAKPGG